MAHIDHAKDFDLQKRLCMEKLYQPDRSRKGDVDTPIISLIDYINNLKNFYTTSSCSGRIMLLTESEKKPDVKWLYVSHEKIEQDQMEQVFASLSSAELTKYPTDRIWLRQENLILHIACRTIDDADMLLKIARELGLRRSGIIADSNLIVVEICSTENMDVPIAQDEEILVSEDYIRLIIQIANERFSKGREKLHKLEAEIKEKLK